MQTQTYHNTPKSKTPEYRFSDNLRRRYLINPAIYQHIMLMQGGGCALCGTVTPERMSRGSGFVVDHDHSTGVVRGILCNPCNIMLGKAKDSITTLNNAISYISEYAQASR